VTLRTVLWGRFSKVRRPLSYYLILGENVCDGLGVDAECVVCRLTPPHQSDIAFQGPELLNRAADEFVFLETAIGFLKNPLTIFLANERAE